MTEKFRKNISRIIYGYLATGIALIILAIIFLAREGVSAIRESIPWQWQILRIAAGVWCVTIVITLFSIIGIRHIKYGE